MKRPSFPIYVCTAFLCSTVLSLPVFLSKAEAAISAACRRNCIPPPVCTQINPVKLAECLKDQAKKALEFPKCQALEVECDTKLGLYKTYMAQLAQGVTMYSLPAFYREMLAPYFGSLGDYTFGYGSRQPAVNATTDCRKTYYNGSGFVSHLAAGNLSLDSNFRWLFHELAHTVQCNQAGGRDFYAKMWFDHLKISVMRSPSTDLKFLHDGMKMEMDAKRVANDVLGKINACCRDVIGRLVRPLEVISLKTNPIVARAQGGTVQVLVQTRGGAEPFGYIWQIKLPSQTAFGAIPPSEGRAGKDRFDWTPRFAGPYQIQVRVSQGRPGLPPAVRAIGVLVQPALGGTMRR